MTRKERQEEKAMRALFHLLIKTGEFERLRSELSAEMAANPDAFEKKRRKHGFPLKEVVVLREMYREWEGTTRGLN